MLHAAQHILVEHLSKSPFILKYFVISYSASLQQQLRISDKQDN